MHDENRQNEQTDARAGDRNHAGRRERGIRENILSPSQWVRILLMIGFGILSWLLRFAQAVITIIQILFALITGKPNFNMSRAGTLLALYQAQIWFYLSYSSDLRPYPFNDLPDSGEDLDESMKAELDMEEEKEPVYSSPRHHSGSAGGPAGAESRAGDRDDVFSDMSFTDSDSADRDTDEDVPTLGGETPDSRRRDDDGQS